MNGSSSDAPLEPQLSEQTPATSADWGSQLPEQPSPSDHHALADHEPKIQAPPDPCQLAAAAPVSAQQSAASRVATVPSIALAPRFTLIERAPRQNLAPAKAPSEPLADSDRPAKPVRIHKSRNANVVVVPAPSAEKVSVLPAPSPQAKAPTQRVKPGQYKPDAQAKKAPVHTQLDTPESAVSTQFDQQLDMPTVASRNNDRRQIVNRQIENRASSELARHVRFDHVRNDQRESVSREAIHTPIPGTLSPVRAQPISAPQEPVAPVPTTNLNQNSKTHVGNYDGYEHYGTHPVAHDHGQDGYGSDMMIPYTSPWVVTVDGIFFKREGDEASSLSAATRLIDFDYRLGARVSLNRRYNSLDGWEVSYVGPYDWIRESRINGANFNTNLNGLNLSAFNNATFHEQAYNSRLNSVELNIKQWGWDVLTTSYGTRFINIDEHLVFNSRNALGEQGRFVVETDNHLFGAQVGLDLKFPLGNLTSITKLKGGIFGNFAETNLLLRNNNTTQIDNFGEDVDFASIIEVGYYLSYQLGPRVSLRGGYETWWVYGLALAPHQFGNPLTGVTGQRVDMNEDLFYHGGTVGIEFVW